MKNIKAEEMAKNQGKYVALDKKESKILASDLSIQKLEKKLKNMDIEDAVIMFVPPVDKYLSPLCRQ